MCLENIPNRSVYIVIFVFSGIASLISLLAGLSVSHITETGRIVWVVFASITFVLSIFGTIYQCTKRDTHRISERLREDMGIV